MFAPAALAPARGAPRRCEGSKAVSSRLTAARPRRICRPTSGLVASPGLHGDVPTLGGRVRSGVCWGSVHMGEAVTVAQEPEAAGRPHRRRSHDISGWLPAGVVVAVAALLSIPRLGVRTLWLDEAYTVGATNQLFDTWRNTAGTQALYYLLVWPISRLSTEPAWLRLPSALLGLAAVVVVLRIGRRVGGRRVGLLAAGGLALSWGLARYAVEARSYTLALLLVSTSWLALIAAVQADGDDDSRRWWRVFYVATALVPLTHGLATLNLLAQLAALAIAPDDRRRMLRRASVIVPVVAVELGALFLLGAADVGDWVPPLNRGQLRSIRQLMVGFDLTGVVLGGLVVLAVVIAGHRFLRERTREAWIQLLPAFWALGPPLLVVLLSLVRPYAASRYVFPSIAGYFLLLAGLLVRLGSTRRVALASLALAPLLLLDHRHVTTDGIEDWAGLTACIAANSVDGDRLVTAAAHRPPLDYYWPEHAELSRVEPLSPPDPLGQVRRLYHSEIETRPEFRSTLLEDTTGSIWYVERGWAGRVSVAGLAFDSEVMARYELHEAWHFEGELSLTRLDPVGADRPRGGAPCDTVEPRPLT